MDRESEPRPQQPMMSIPLEEIDPNPYQPRRQFNQVALQELVASVAEHGVLQPILVRRNGFRYQLVSGERRFQASKRAGLRVIPAVVHSYSDREMLEVAIVENVQREDISPLEAARAYKRLIDEFGLTQEQVALRVGKSRPAVANTLRLLKLPAPIQAALACGDITEGHARSLLSIRDPDWQTRVFNRIVQQDLSVREVERLAYGAEPEEEPDSETGEEPAERARVPRETKGDRSELREAVDGPASDPNLRSVESRLRLLLGSRVRIRGGLSRGSITVDYYSEDDLERILGLLGLV